MALILKVAAAVLTVIGAVTLYWGTSPSLLSLGNTVMIVGAVIGVGGVILFGLAAVLAQLQRLGTKLDALGGALAPAVVVPRDAPARQHPAESAPPVAVEPVLAPPAEPPSPILVAPADLPPPPPSVMPPSVTPPTRRSFGLPPLPGTMAAAGGAAAGLAGGLLAGSASAAPAAEKPGDRGPGPGTAAVPVEPVVPEIVVPEIERDNDVERAEARFGDLKGAPAVEPKVPPPAPAFAHAVAQMKDEVKAAEADLAVPEDDSNPDDGPTDHLASLERLLLGVSAGGGRAPAEPEDLPEEDERPSGPRFRPVPMEPSRAEPRFEELRDTGPEDAEPEDAEPEDAEASESARAEPAAKEPAARPAAASVLDTDDFMERLRETIARPVMAPVLPPVPAAPEPSGPELPPPPPPAPAAAAAPPPLSIEEELERALKASFATPEPEPEPPAPARVEAASLPRSLPPERPVAAEPAVAPAATPEPGKTDDPMAALARDFPELNDILAPKKPAADPAHSLIEDLKDIFEPAARPAARQEPVVPPAPAAPVKPPLLREGVIANIPFRLYGDGTIEADLEEGTRQFASLKDFRAHVGG